LLEDIVKADESYFGKKRSKQPQLVVTGAVEPHTSRCALRITGISHAGRSRKVLEQFICDSVKPGTMVVTDKWYGYDELPLLGYGHESHNHSKGDYADTNHAENMWSVGKRHMRKLYGGRLLTRRLEDFCKEWMARANKPELFGSPTDYLRFTLVPR
jgi:transposase